MVAILDFIDDKFFIGIGETGLDYFYGESNKDNQIKSFQQHIEIARKFDFPVIIHTRSADADTIDIIKKEYLKAPFRGLIHCFTASEELAREVLKMNFFISLSGIITFKNASQIRETIKVIPNDRLLVETDAPYLAPMPFRGKRNEPSFVKNTTEYLSKLKNVSLEDMSHITTNNFFKLFNKAKH